MAVNDERMAEFRIRRDDLKANLDLLDRLKSSQHLLNADDSRKLIEATLNAEKAIRGALTGYILASKLIDQ